MLAPVSAAHFSWSLRLVTFIMVNILVALDAIFWGDYCVNNCYLLINLKNRYTRSGDFLK